MAIVFYGHEITFRELDDLSDRFADYLPHVPAYPIHPTMGREKMVLPETMDFKELVEQTAPDTLDPGIDLAHDLAILQYTAGTTGKPKGVMLTHGNLALHGRIVRHYYEYAEDDVHLLVLPVFHVTGLDIAMNPALAQGSTLVMFARFDQNGYSGRDPHVPGYPLGHHRPHQYPRHRDP